MRSRYKGFQLSGAEGICSSVECTNTNHRCIARRDHVTFTRLPRDCLDSHRISSPRATRTTASITECQLVLFYDVRPEGVSLVNCGAIRMELSSQHNARRTGR